MGRVVVYLQIAVVAFALAGCGGGSKTHQLLSGTITPAPASAIAATHSIFVATTRAPAADHAEVFSRARSPDLSLAKVEVSVPASHKLGATERPKRGVRDPAKYFTATSVTGYDEKAFAQALRSDIKKRGGRAIVFIHGYNTKFDDAVYRMTQLVHDAGYDGTPILFTWASGGRVTDYVYDSNSAHAARDQLEATLRLVSHAGAKRVDILAHSMGNWVTMEALRQLAITDDRDLDGRLGDVLLASPDIDVDVFKTQMQRYGKPDKPFIVLLSADDRALRISGLIAGNRPRVGDYGDAAELAELGVTVVNVSDVASGDRLNHSKFADNPVLVKLLGERLRAGDTIASETELADRIGNLTTGIGHAVTSAANIIITTPLRVVTVAVGG
ncbi:alpha/beta hydrolase [Arvimicrobium flavum]|uniref:alpha/beta hydrolase n=1 Tax=Arvimicrobium flavum TaxID=3393320 RepID=UPI00237A125F|nr:alpha/beta hydrolase [Mesorhizobium shangrilense]